jgi:chromate transporter
MATAATPPAAPRATLSALFCEFLKIALLGAGGGVALAHRIAVERRQWLAEAEFTDILALSQFMPGPNVLGIAVCVGTKLRGLAGAAVSVAGFVLVPGIVGFTFATLLLGTARSPLVDGALGGISAAAAGLMIAVGLRVLRPRWRQPSAVLVAGFAFAGLAVARVPLPLVLLVLAPLSTMAAVFGDRRSR